MLARLLRGALWLASASVIGLYLFFAIRRLSSPVPLDPGESVFLDHAIRLAHMKPLYDEPGQAVPVSIMPAFPLTLAVLVQSLGPHSWEPRLISLLGFLGLAAVALSVVRTETESWTLGVVGAALTLAGCGILAGPPGLARPEALTLVLSVTAFLALRDIDGSLGALIAALLLAVACFTQQMALWFVGAATIHLAREEKRRLVPFVLGFAVLGAGGYVLLSRLLGSWFNFYAWDAALAGLRLDPAGLVHLAGDQILGRMGILIVAALLSCALPTPAWRGPAGVWTWMGLAAIAAGLLGSQSGARSGALIPAIVAVAVVGPIAAYHVVDHLCAWPGSSRRGGRSVVFAALLLQLLLYLSAVSPTQL
jgi:hypothetical protein